MNIIVSVVFVVLVVLAGGSLHSPALPCWHPREGRKGAIAGYIILLLTYSVISRCRLVSLFCSPIRGWPDVAPWPTNQPCLVDDDRRGDVDDSEFHAFFLATTVGIVNFNCSFIALISFNNFYNWKLFYDPIKLLLHRRAGRFTWKIVNRSKFKCGIWSRLKSAYAG